LRNGLAIGLQRRSASLGLGDRVFDRRHDGIRRRLERDVVQARFRARPPTSAQIDDFLATYAEQPVRLVQTTRNAPWLGGTKKGWAVTTLAPSEVFTLAKAGTIDTPDGPFDVAPLGTAA